jgi:S-adenosylmethionine decarboxylase
MEANTGVDANTGVGMELGGAEGDLHMRLHAADIWVTDVAILTDCGAVQGIMRDAAVAGGATVLAEEFVAFPNGAFTGVLVLAQSHLSVHTWPELAMANVDLLSYGTLAGETMIETIAGGLGAEALKTTCITRGIRPPSSATRTFDISAPGVADV